MNIYPIQQEITVMSHQKLLQAIGRKGILTKRDTIPLFEYTFIEEKHRSVKEKVRSFAVNIALDIPYWDDCQTKTKFQCPEKESLK